MKKKLVLALLMAAIAGGAFAQISLSVGAAGRSRLIF